MSDLPDSWVETPLGDVTADSAQRVPAPDEQFQYVDIASIDRLTKRIINPQLLWGRDAPSRARKEIRAGDILVSMTRPNLNAVALVPPEFDRQIASTGFDVLRSTGVEPRWLFYIVRTQSFIDRMSEQVQGALYPAVRSKDVRSYVAPLAPLSEQKRIADKLDAVLAQVDACRERLDRVPAILKRFRQAVLAAATSGTLTEEWREANSKSVDATELAAQLHTAHEVAGGHKAGNAAPPTDDVHDLSADMFPRGWSLLTLRDLVLPNRPITYGILKPGPELEQGVPYIRVADFPNERLNLSTIRKTSPNIDEEFKRSRLKSGDLLLSIRGTVGRLIVIPEELESANITQDSARLSIQPFVNRDYVLWFLRSELAQTRMQRAVKGVAVRGINIGDVRALQVPLPSRAEQNEIVRRVETLFAYADRLEARYNAARARVERLTPTLLAKAFRGELVPQDPNDEPASVLLERIRAARAEQPTGKRRHKPSAVRVPRAPKEKAAMTKSRLDDDVQHKPYLAGLLREAGGIASVEDLFRRAELPVTDFYKQLAWEVEKGHIRDDETRLEAA